MRKLLALLAVIGMLTFGASSVVVAQVEGETAEDTEMAAENGEMTEDTAAEETTDEKAVVEEETTDTAEASVDEADAAKLEGKGIHQQIKQKFIEGGAGFMGFVLITLILGLAISIERIIYLSLASTNTEKLLKNLEVALESGGVEEAKEVCRSTRGPVASIFYQGLDRYEEGIEVVEKSVESYGSVQMGLLEKGLTWISLMIALAPMLGFMGTVIGMIGAFDAIQAAGDISPSLVAGGIKVALITTVTGLIVAMVLQIFYNYLVSKIDGIVNKMEDASISLIDILVKFSHK